MSLTLHKLRSRTPFSLHSPLKPSCFCWGGLGYQNNTPACRNAEGRESWGWMSRGRLGGRGAAAGPDAGRIEEERKKGWEPEQLSNSSGSSQELVLGENSPYTALHVLLLGF